MNLWRFSVMAVAVTMGAVAHLIELPAKMQYEPSLWVRLYRTMYPNFGRTAGPAEAAAVISTTLLAWRTWREIAINGWNRVAIPFRAEVGSYQPGAAEAAATLTSA